MARGNSTTVFLVWTVLSVIVSTARAAIVVPDKALAVFAFSVGLCALAWFAFRGVVFAQGLCFVLAALFGAAAAVVFVADILGMMKATDRSLGQILASVFWFVFNGLVPIVFCVLFLRETPKTGVRRNLWRWPFGR